MFREELKLIDYILLFNFVGFSLFFCCSRIKMKVQALALIGFAMCISAAYGQFQNGRILEPPVPAQCAERVIHERAPDGKG